MPIIAKQDPPELPDTEQVPVICVDVELQEPFLYQGEMLQSISYAFLIGGRRMKDGRPFMVRARFPWKMSPKSTHRLFLNAWKGGKPWTDKEVSQGIDVEKWALGRGGLTTPVLEPGKTDPSRVYPKIVSVVPLPKAMEPELPPWKDYIRLKDRPPKEGDLKRPAPEAWSAKNQDEVPF